MSKYKPGRRIDTFDDLIKQELIIFRPYPEGRYSKVYHRGWFMSWQIQMVMQLIARGCLYTAEVIESDNGKTA